MTHTFQVGQVLTCIDNDFRGDYSDKLTVGKEYPITEVSRSGRPYILDDDGTSRLYFQYDDGTTVSVSTHFTWPGKPTYAEDMARIGKLIAPTRSEQLAAALLDSPEPPYQPTRLDYFTAAALTGLMGKDYVKLTEAGGEMTFTNLDMVGKMAITIAKETIKQLDQ